MSPPFSLGSMPGTKKEKHYANSRARRGSIVVSQAGSKKSKKDTDTESVSSEASSAIPPPPPPPPAKAKCPLRPYMEVMFDQDENDDEKKKAQCPLRRVKLSHVLPLCLFVMINMCLVVGTLLITGACRIFVTVWDLGKKQPKEADSIIYNHTVYNPDFTAFTTLAVALFAFVVTICYGPGWMSTTFQIFTSTGFFIGLSMTLMAKKDVKKVQSTPTTPTTPVLPET